MRQANIDMNGKTILVTGAAGFIGANLVCAVLASYRSVCIIGVDNLNAYYDVSLKEYRLEKIRQAAERYTDSEWHFLQGNIADGAFVGEVFTAYQPTIVVNLAAQAGVRYSITNPDAYIESNILGFYQILEACRHSYDKGRTGVEHLVYASSSSVYGGNHKIPFDTEDRTDEPVSLYAATKKSNELLAHAYAKLYNIPCTGLRFFTVYGPGGRPDMAYFQFADKLVQGETIRIFNYGNCQRDFTYIDDIVEGILRVLCCSPKRACGTDGLPIPPSCIYNIGNGHPEKLMDFVEILHQEMIRAGILPEDHDLCRCRELVAMQPGDVPVTYADCTKLEEDFGVRPNTSLKEGLQRFVRWYKEYYEV